MMTNSVRAVVENGMIRLLEPIDLVEGQQIEVTITTERDRAIEVLGDLLVQIPEQEDAAADDASLMKEIEDAFRGQQPLSETIMEERREGP